MINGSGPVQTCVDDTPEDAQCLANLGQQTGLRSCPGRDGTGGGWHSSSSLTLDSRHPYDLHYHTGMYVCMYLHGDGSLAQLRDPATTTRRLAGWVAKFLASSRRFPLQMSRRAKEQQQPAIQPAIQPSGSPVPPGYPGPARLNVDAEASLPGCLARGPARSHQTLRARCRWMRRARSVRAG